MALVYKVTPYNGLYVDSSSLPQTADIFSVQLKEIIGMAKDTNRSLIWLDLPITCSNFIPVAVDSGFVFHHTDSDKLTLVYRVQPDSFVPGYATHYIGAGGVVLDEDRNILVIQEKHHKIRHYKLPGGTLDPGEHISTAVCREVLEETGIETEFLGISCFRHFHGYKFGKSDIYFTCLLKPLTKKITIDTREVVKAVWMPVEEYLNHPDTMIFNRRIVEAALEPLSLKRESIPGYKSDETHEMLF